MAEFIAEYNGFQLKHDQGYTVFDFLGLKGPPIRFTRQDTTGRHGGHVWARLYGPRPIKITGEVWGDTAEEYFDRVSSLIDAFSLGVSNELLITRWDGIQKRIKAVTLKQPEEPEQGANVTHSPFTIELLAEDPFYLDLEDEVYTTGLGVAGGGEVPTEVPMSLSPSTGDTITITNNGNEDIDNYASFKISGEVVNPTVQNLTTGEMFQINTTVDAGDFVRISITNNSLSVQLNDSQDYFQYLLGDIFEIVPGTNTIKFSASTFSGSAILEITYSNKYLTA